MGCGGGGGGAVPAKSGVAVTVSGLAAGKRLTLWNNDQQALTVTSNGSFTAQVLPRASYTLSVVDQPDGQYCTVTNGTGTDNGSNPTVAVNCSVPPQQGISATTEVTTFAGSGLAGYIDGDGAIARFSNPSGAAVDSAGNVYVADADNHLIRKIVPSGVVSTLAGSGSRGRADGNGAAASFYEPRGITVDGADNVYVADTGNNLIRKISPAGTVTTVAGSGFPGSADGPATTATFYLPVDVKFDAAGNLYVADSGYNFIRKVSPGGVVSTIAGMDSPNGLAIDSNANLYVASWNSDIICKINHATTLAQPLISTFAGSGLPGNSNGPSLQASFFRPFYLAVDKNDNIYVSEAIRNPYITTVNMKIRVITPSGMVSDYAGTGAAGGDNGDGTVATFNNPAGIAFDADGNLYVADSSNNQIRKIRRVN